MTAEAVEIPESLENLENLENLETPDLWISPSPSGDSGDITDEPAKPAPEKPVQQTRRPRGRPRGSTKKKDDKPVPPANLKIPDFSEWHEYIGNFAIKWGARAYIAYCFRGIDRWEVLSDAENEALEPDSDQLSDIAKPLAHIAERSKLGKKYGRMLIDASDGCVAVIQLAMWGNRVNRIARKYRKGSVNDQPGGTSGEGIPEESQISPNGVTGPNWVPNGHGFN